MNVDSSIEMDDLWPSSSEQDPTLPPEEQDQVNPNLLKSMAAPESYFEVSWSLAACADLAYDDPLRVGFTQDVHYKAGRGARMLTPDAKASIAVCLACPIMSSCGNHGFSEQGGIWGAMTEQMRFDHKEVCDDDLEWLQGAGEAMAEESTVKGRLAALREYVRKN